MGAGRNYMAESVILVQGKPGAGKSSCCRNAIAEAGTWASGFPTRHLSVGQHFRGILAGSVSSMYASEVKRSVGNNPDAQAVMALPAHQLLQGIVEEYIQGLDEPGITLVDGYPKEPEVLPLLRNAMGAGILSVRGCLYLDVSDEVAVKRQLERAPHNGSHPEYDEEMAMLRVRRHNEQTEPVVRQLSILYGGYVIDGSQEFSLVRRHFVAAAGDCVIQYEARPEAA
jgi:adenylate kinase family enzyme